MLLSLPIEEIVERYEKGESLAKIGSYLGADKRTIRRRLINENVHIRSAGESAKILKNKAFVESSLVKELIDGLLLGDAWLEQSHEQDNARLAIEVTKKSEDWLKQISDALSEHGVKCSIKYRKTRDKTINGVRTFSKESALLRTSLYPNFSTQRERWYPYGSKIVPRDLELTEISIAHWYWGDGSTNKYQIRLYTNNFKEADCEFLIGCLLKFGVRFSINQNRGKPVLDLFNNSERERFLDLIRNHVPKCFKYKVQKPVIVRRSPPTLPPGPEPR